MLFSDLQCGKKTGEVVVVSTKNPFTKDQKLKHGCPLLDITRIAILRRKPADNTLFT